VSGEFISADQAARDRIRDSLDETLFVEAGAGTGKTTSLVDRMMGLVSTGRATLDRIAVITFTESAAAELRDRVREALEKAVDDAGLGDGARERCRQGIGDIDQASIQTLHSFAADLLQARPLEAGLPPGFQVMDRIAADLAFEDEWKRWLDTTLDDAASGQSFARSQWPSTASTTDWTASPSRLQRTRRPRRWTRWSAPHRSSTGCVSTLAWERTTLWSGTSTAS
jgi:ATP-dependent exoDNAse (exonuclease V) beta subunit